MANKIKVKFYSPIINYSDYQTRICKNIPEIRWEGKVHERLVGYKKHSSLPPNYELDLQHIKTIEKQRTQNEFYAKIIK